MLIDDPWISRQIFYPRSSRAEPTLVVEVPGARLACFYCQRYPEAGVLLHFHGNGELAAEYAEDYAELFLAMGINVCFAEYRGYGRSTGAPALGAMLPDGEHIVQALGIPPARIVAFGRSLGSIYATELARRLPQLAAVIIESGVVDVAEALVSLIGTTADLPFTEEELAAEIQTYVNLKSSLQSYRGKLLVLHASEDGLLDRSHAERLHAWAGSDDKTLVRFPEGNHNSILAVNYPEYLHHVKSFLDRAGVTVPEEAGAS